VFEQQAELDIVFYEQDPLHTGAPQPSPVPPTPGTQRPTPNA
jgi:hypothetical protein